MRHLVPLVLVVSACNRDVTQDDIDRAIDLVLYGPYEDVEFLHRCPTDDGGALLTAGTAQGVVAIAVDEDGERRGETVFDGQMGFIGGVSSCKESTIVQGSYNYLLYGADGIAARSIDPMNPVAAFGNTDTNAAVIDAHVYEDGVEYAEVYSAEHRLLNEDVPGGSDYVLNPWVMPSTEQMVSSWRTPDGLVAASRTGSGTHVWLQNNDGVQQSDLLGDGAGALSCVGSICILPLYGSNDIAVIDSSGGVLNVITTEVAEGPVNARLYESPSFAGFTATVTHFGTTEVLGVKIDAMGEVVETAPIPLEGAEDCEENIVDLIWDNLPIEEPGSQHDGWAVCDREEIGRIRTTFQF